MINDLARIKRDIGNLHPAGGLVHRLVQEIEDLREAYRLLDLIVMEFRTDPTSVQCFDLDAIVEPAKAIVAKVEEGRS